MFNWQIKSGAKALSTRQVPKIEMHRRETNNRQPHQKYTKKERRTAWKNVGEFDKDKIPTL